MSCRRVFANNNDISYNYYYNKFRQKNKRINRIYECFNGNGNRIKAPINIIDGSISCYVNKHEFNESNCVECINSVDLCNEKVCNNQKVLYPHGRYKIRYYNRCKNTKNPTDLNNMIYDLDKIYELDTVNTTIITKLTDNFIPNPIVT